MNISKTIAHNAASKIAEPLNAAWKQARKDFITQVENEIIEQMPGLVQEVMQKHPEWLKKMDYKYCITHNGQHLDRIDFFCNGNIQASDKAYKLYQRISEKHELYENTVRQIEKTLFMLRTYKRVSEHYPEALPFLPTDKKALPALDISIVREKTKELIQTA